MADNKKPAWLKMGTPEEQQAQLAAMGMSDPTSVTIKQSVQNPDVFQKAEMARQELQALRQQRMTEEQAGIGNYEKEIAKANEGQGGLSNVDWRPLAALLDRGPGARGGLYKAASDQADSSQAKSDKLQAMKAQLQAMKAGLSKSQYDALKDQLDSYNSEANSISAEKRLQASMSAKDESQARLRERDIEKDVQSLSKQVQGKAQMDDSIKQLNAAMGFNIDDYDSSTNTVNGKPVDLPGVSIPGVGRVAAYDPRARRVEDTVSRIFNTELKDRSGAAVTNQELERLKNEFSSGRFQTEPEKLQAVKDYKRILNEELNRREAAFRPVVRETFKKRIDEDAGKISERTPVSALQPVAPGAGLSAEKAARLEELRKKLGK